jgi:membrane dipeptidase
VVQLVGPEHVGLGLDVVFDAQPLMDWMRTRPDEWPDTRDPHWPGVRYAVPEQLPELIDLMLEAGYGERAVAAVLGGNLLRVCGAVWR